MNKLSKVFKRFIIPPRDKISALITGTDSSKGYKLLRNYGFIIQSSNGMYGLLPLGQRIIQKLIKHIDQQMHLINAHRISLPMLTQEHLWKNAGTYDQAGKELYTITDRHNAKFILSPTHEEAFAYMISKELMSYKDFPLLLYQVNSKFRDEMQPRHGLLRSKEFMMKDLYSADISAEKAKKTYEIVTKAYEKIFKLLEIKYVTAESQAEFHTVEAHEYYYLNEVGDEKLFTCISCGYTTTHSLLQDRRLCPGCSYYVKPECFYNGIEIAHTFNFGTYYSDRLGSCFVNRNCQREPLHICSYGIGLSRLLSATVEVLSEDDELRWPLAMAPYTVCIIPPKGDKRDSIIVELLLPELYQLLDGIPGLKGDVIVDDRVDKSIGKRVREAKCYGFPFIVIAGSDATQDTPLFELLDINKQKKYLMPRSSLLQYILDRTKSLVPEEIKLGYLTTT